MRLIDGEEDSRLALGVAGHFRCEFTEQKFTGQVIDSMRPYVEETIADGQAPSPVTRGMIEIGNTAGGEAPQHVGVVRLHLSVVSSADDCQRDGVKCPRFSAS